LLQDVSVKERRNESIRSNSSKYANKKYDWYSCCCCYGCVCLHRSNCRLTSLETSRELFQADLLKKSEQKPTDQEQFMLIESLFEDVEKLITNQEQNMTNKVNIEFLKTQLEKALQDVEELKDKVRANGNGHG